jgi:hypothetical protein
MVRRNWPCGGPFGDRCHPCTDFLRTNSHAPRLDDSDIAAMAFHPEGIPQHSPQRVLALGAIPSVHLSRAFAAQQDDGLPRSWTGTNEVRHRLRLGGLFGLRKARPGGPPSAFRFIKHQRVCCRLWPVRGKDATRAGVGGPSLLPLALKPGCNARSGILGERRSCLTRQDNKSLNPDPGYAP